jgi:hypothetical protein
MSFMKSQVYFEKYFFFFIDVVYNDGFIPDECYLLRWFGLRRWFPYFYEFIYTTSVYYLVFSMFIDFVLLLRTIFTECVRSAYYCLFRCWDIFILVLWAFDALVLMWIDGLLRI